MCIYVLFCINFPSHKSAFLLCKNQRCCSLHILLLLSQTLHLYLLRLKDAVDTYQLDMVGLSGGLKPFSQRPASGSNRPSLHNGVDNCDKSLAESVDVGYPANGRRSSHRSRKEYVKTFNRGLKELTNVQEEVWTILKENAELVSYSLFIRC